MQRKWLGGHIGMESKGVKVNISKKGNEGQQQERNKSKHQRQPRHEPQTGELANIEV